MKNRKKDTKKEGRLMVNYKKKTLLVRRYYLGELLCYLEDDYEEKNMSNEVRIAYRIIGKAFKESYIIEKNKVKETQLKLSDTKKEESIEEES